MQDRETTIISPAACFNRCAGNNDCSTTEA
uniref:Uncharacterized protein n=1 Tax=Anguilla anguilla TaxID=7936 RepID=A0A0E9RTD7_ANGAN